VFTAALERTYWPLVYRLLFDRSLPIKFRPLVTPSLN